MEERLSRMEKEVERLRLVISGNGADVDKAVALPELRRIRKYRGFGAHELAQRAEVSPASIYRAETQGTRMTIHRVVKVAQALKVSVEHLRGLRPYVVAEGSGDE